MPFTMLNLGQCWLGNNLNTKNLLFSITESMQSQFLKRSPASHLINNEKLILKFWAGEMAQWVKVRERTSEIRNKSQAYLPVSVRYLTTKGEVTTNSGADDRNLQIIFHMISAMRNTRQCRRLKPRRNEQCSSFFHLCLVCAGNHHHPLVLQLSIRVQVALVCPISRFPCSTLQHSPP